MTARQRKFAEYYAKSGNATQSAVKAGYSKKFAHTNASRFLNVEEVKAYVRELTEKGQRERIMSAAAGGKPLTAVNLVEKRTVVSAPSITVNIGKDAVDKVKTQIVDGRKCLIINLDDPEIEVNGLETTIK